MTTTSSTGGWFETVAPGVQIKLDPATMPHALVSEGGGVFTFKQLDWDPREAGDDSSCPAPSFVGRQLNDVFFARNRLGFLAGENVILSRAGGQYYAFFREKASQVLDTDQIDVASTDKEISLLTAALPFSEDIVLFSSKAQFRLTSGSELMTAKTVELKPISRYPNFTGVSPVVSGGAIYFASDSGENSLLMEMLVDQGGATAGDLTEHCPRFLPPNLQKIAWCSAERVGVVLSRAEPNAVYVYGYYNRGQERLMASWSRWSWDESDRILDISVTGSDLVLVIQRADGLHIEAMSLSTSRNDAGSDHTIHLDRRITNEQCTCTYDGGVTVVTLPYSNAAPGLQVWQRRATGLPRQLHMVRRGSNQLVLTGDKTETPFFVGFGFESAYEFSEQFVRAQDSVRTDGRFQLRRFSINHGRTGGYIAEVSNPKRTASATVDLQDFASDAWSVLVSYDGTPIEAEGVSLTFDDPEAYVNSYTGSISGSVAGVLPDGRYFIRLSVPDYENTDVAIQPDLTFSFPASWVGIKSVSVIRARDNAPIHRRVFGHGGPTGAFLVVPGVRLLVAPGIYVARELPPGDGGLVIHEGKVSIRAQAKAILAACSRGEEDSAMDWTRALLQTQEPDGSFPSEVDPVTGVETDVDVDLETQLWAILALARVLGDYPSHRYAADIAGQLTALLAFVEGEYLDPRVGVPTSGLFVENGDANTGANLLAYFAFLAAGAASLAADLAADIMANLWNLAEGRFSAGADAAGQFDQDQLLAEPLAPLFLTAIGQTEKAKLAELWQQYFVSGSGRALGLAETAIGLENQGDWDATPAALHVETTLEDILSKVALGDRESARAALAALEPATGLSPEDLAMICIVTDPAGIFGLGGDPLWAEGVVVDDRSQTFSYRFLSAQGDDSGTFSFPVNTNSEDAVIRLKSLGALPFGALSAEVEGYFTARAQRV